MKMALFWNNNNDDNYVYCCQLYEHICDDERPWHVQPLKLPPDTSHECLMSPEIVAQFTDIIYWYLGKPVMLTHWLAGTAPHKSGRFRDIHFFNAQHPNEQYLSVLIHWAYISRLIKLNRLFITIILSTYYLLKTTQSTILYECLVLCCVICLVPGPDLFVHVLVSDGLGDWESVSQVGCNHLFTIVGCICIQMLYIHIYIQS